MSQAGSYIYLKNGLHSRPLWGIYISILFAEKNHKFEEIDSSHPLWGIYISIRKNQRKQRKEDWFSSPMGYLYFYSRYNWLKGFYLVVLVPYGVSIFLFTLMDMVTLGLSMVLVPYGVSIFLF